MLLTNDLDSPKFFCRKALNSIQIERATSLSWQRLNYIHRILMFLWRKEAAKEGLVGRGGPRGLKIIFTLLVEVVAVHVRFTIIYIWHFSFKGLFVLLWRLTRFLVGLQVSFHELFEQFIDRGQSWSRSPRDSWKMSGSIATFNGGSNGPSVSSSLLPAGGLRRERQRVHGPAIAWSKSENFFFQTGWLTR